MWWSTRSLLVTFWALAFIYLCRPVLGVVLSSHNGGSADFRFVSRNDNAHISLSSSRASRCSQIIITMSSSAWDIWLSQPCHRLESRESSMKTQWEWFGTQLRLACWLRPDFSLARVRARLGAWSCYYHSAIGWGPERSLSLCTHPVA